MGRLSQAARWAVGVAVVYAACVAFFTIVAGRGDPAWFIHLGSRRIPVANGTAQRLLGPDVVVPHTDGHDGRFFWIQARDPLLLHPRFDAANLDRPVYRAQRIAYPALAAPWRALGERGLVVGLVLTNLAGVAMGTYAASALASRIGAPPRAAAAMALNPAVMIAVGLDLGDALGVAAVLWMALLLWRRRPGLAVVAAVIAVLAKEPFWLCVAAAALTAPGWSRRWRLVLAGGPAVAAALWASYVRFRFGASTSIEEFAPPLYGFLDAYRIGWRPEGNWSDALAAVGGLALAVVIVVRWWRRRTMLLAMALPLATLFPFLSAQVLDLADNSLRALGPGLTLLALDWYAGASPAIPTPRRPVGADGRASSRC